MDLSKFFGELLVVIVLFKKDPEQSLAYTSLQAAVNFLHAFPIIFLYDNSPGPALPAELPLIYHHHSENNGVSKAYNEAAAIAIKEDKKWMLLLDQDTQVDARIFQIFFDATLRYPESVALVPRMEDKLGILSPFQFSLGGGKRKKISGEGKFPLDEFRFINSGLLIKTIAFIDAGGYEEDIPLDFSDIAFGQKLKKITDHFVLVNVSCQHDFSGTTTVGIDEASGRFYYYCIGALKMGQKFGGFYLYLARSFVRAGRLGWKFRSFKFVHILLERIRHG